MKRILLATIILLMLAGSGLAQEATRQVITLEIPGVGTVELERIPMTDQEVQEMFERTNPETLKKKYQWNRFDVVSPEEEREI